VPYLIKAVQELSTLNSNLKVNNDLLSTKNDLLEGRVKVLEDFCNSFVFHT
jgi:hypothetical protein